MSRSGWIELALSQTQDVPAPMGRLVVDWFTRAMKGAIKIGWCRRWADRLGACRPARDLTGPRTDSGKPTEFQGHGIPDWNIPRVPWSMELNSATSQRGHGKGNGVGIHSRADAGSRMAAGGRRARRCPTGKDSAGPSDEPSLRVVGDGDNSSMISRRRRSRPVRRGQNAEKDPFDIYLEGALGRYYEDVLDESLPTKIADLATQLQSKIKTSDLDDEGGSD